MATWHLLAASGNGKSVEKFQPAASTRRSGEHREKLPISILSEHASDFCYDRKSALRE